MAELGQCGLAVACAGAALALYPKSQPVRRLVVSGLDLKLCAEVRVCVRKRERERERESCDTLCTREYST